MEGGSFHICVVFGSSWEPDSDALCVSDGTGSTGFSAHGGRPGGTDSSPYLCKPGIRSDRVHPSLTFRINSAYICRNAQDVGFSLYKKERMLCIRLMK